MSAQLACYDEDVPVEGTFRVELEGENGPVEVAIVRDDAGELHAISDICSHGAVSLSDGARADSVPNLEIETGLIEGAGHASATGRFDDEQLFYLRARGIPEPDARRLVVRGFFAELIHEIGVPSVEERLLGAIEQELEKSMSVLDVTSVEGSEVGLTTERA